MRKFTAFGSARRRTEPTPILLNRKKTAQKCKFHKNIIFSDIFLLTM
nr:MAG TPA: hypothetical protein [Caudoviricetes sp.]